jgi:hypothetical protein
MGARASGQRGDLIWGALEQETHRGVVLHGGTLGRRGTADGGAVW